MVRCLYPHEEGRWSIDVDDMTGEPDIVVPELDRNSLNSNMRNWFVTTRGADPSPCGRFLFSFFSCLSQLVSLRASLGRLQTFGLSVRGNTTLGLHASMTGKNLLKNSFTLGPKPKEP